MQNAERFMIAAIRDAAGRLGVEFSLHSDAWLIRLERAGLVRHVIGYDCGLNTSAAAKVAIDKAATSAVLARAGVAHVPHHIFFAPDMHYFVAERKSFADAHGLFQALGQDVVVKPNEGTGGNSVMRCRSPLELDEALLKIFPVERALVIAPFLKIQDEHRTIVLNGQVRFMFRKRRATVTGDGQTPLYSLVAGYLDGIDMPSRHRAEAALIASRMAADAGLDLLAPLPLGQTFLIDWRHNLARGAAAEEIPATDPRYRAIADLALAAAHAIGIAFASVDIVATGGAYRVLEINSGVTIDKMAAHLTDGRARAQAMYDDVVRGLFGV